jgi:hypothetical protein
MKNVLSGFIISICICFTIALGLRLIEGSPEQPLKPYILKLTQNTEAFYSPDNGKDYLWLQESSSVIVVAEKGNYFKIATERGYFWIKK